MKGKWHEWKSWWSLNLNMSRAFPHYCRMWLSCSPHEMGQWPLFIKPSVSHSPCPLLDGQCWRLCVGGLGSRPLCVRGPGFRPLCVRGPGSRPLYVRGLGSRPLYVSGLGSRPLCVESLGSRPLCVRSLGSRPLCVRGLGSRPTVSPLSLSSPSWTGQLDLLVWFVWP